MKECIARKIDYDILQKASNYVAKSHKGLIKKYTKEPYLNYCMEVATEVFLATGDVEASAAAILSGALEGTETTVEELQQEFGEELTYIVSCILLLAVKKNA